MNLTSADFAFSGARYSETMLQMQNRQAALGRSLTVSDPLTCPPGGVPPSVLSWTRRAASGPPQSNHSDASCLLACDRRCL